MRISGLGFRFAGVELRDEAHAKQRPPRTLQQAYASGSTVVLEGGAVSYERGTPVMAS